MLKYSKSYIDGLLSSPAPIKAIYALCDIWSARPGRSEEDEFFGLSEPEFHVHLYLHYQGEIGNGGHWQFFFNPFGRHSAAVSRALAALQFHRATDLFCRACSVFPSGEVPANHAARQAFIDQLPESATQLWDALDREFYTFDSSYWTRLLAYLREHDAQILQPERA